LPPPRLLGLKYRTDQGEKIGGQKDTDSNNFVFHLFALHLFAIPFFNLTSRETPSSLHPPDD